METNWKAESAWTADERLEVRPTITAVARPGQLLGASSRYHLYYGVARDLAAEGFDWVRIAWGYGQSETALVPVAQLKREGY